MFARELERTGKGGFSQRVRWARLVAGLGTQDLPGQRTWQIRKEEVRVSRKGSTVCEYVGGEEVTPETGSQYLHSAAQE